MAENTQENQQDQNLQENTEDINNTVENNETNEQEVTSEVSELDKLKAELNEANDKYLRLYAEFDNYKRRTSKERIDILQTAGKDVIVSLLVILDDFERAEKSIESAQDLAPVKEGVELIHHKLKSLLSQKGLRPMESKGEIFDADIHEAVTNIPAPSEDLKGKVIDELERGYYLNDKVIRYAKVVVGA
ncbi:GrpE protein [Pseudopedobacter saltans DSM 12145]|uniref:Protein GrpE n=1 Tax=Pseudopedobacter saltans (strain ATCC 51119 / DSM 12145 / JCM 21818 / CCUG 39354 / LMG 10337 / NBRC 100064 / NCIMB 13643) TaxID=762903 RepID=F0S7M7_PSESL|nr:nucleotide exchange factor GrpE [Pseudopedobacter saltans]ADY52287.1 GrpE protein [Pseudopedobacter saltans DSM 12145]